ncbi:MAG: hypothetical protein CFE24_06555 [Flavobacterium sp. BFFFF2]|nr:MAG: hypothetical protein CFE24_06555 [Flavobacterium sp. BFFFF2]
MIKWLSVHRRIAAAHAAIYKYNFSIVHQIIFTGIGVVSELNKKSAETFIKPFDAAWFPLFGRLLAI